MACCLSAPVPKCQDLLDFISLSGKLVRDGDDGRCKAPEGQCAGSLTSCWFMQLPLRIFFIGQILCAQLINQRDQKLAAFDFVRKSLPRALSR